MNVKEHITHYEFGLFVKDASLEENAPIIQWTYGNNNEDTNDEWMFVPVQ